MLKFDFSVQTRNGQKIDSIVIAGQDQADAERKLFQMYRHCTVLHCQTRVVQERIGSGVGGNGGAVSSVEDLVDLIAKEDARK